MMKTILFPALEQVYPLFGLSGSFLILMGCWVAKRMFTGKEGESFSLTNHFISELGEREISKAAVLFNTLIVIGGILYIPFVISVGLILNSTWGMLGAIAGTLASISFILVGSFSRDALTLHRVVSVIYFISGLLMLFFFTIAIFVQPSTRQVIPLPINLIGVTAILCYADFLILISHKTDRNNFPSYIPASQVMPARPKFWRTAFLEWLMLLLTVGWYFFVSLVLIF